MDVVHFADEHEICQYVYTDKFGRVVKGRARIKKSAKGRMIKKYPNE